jgi:hypothetical protein
VLSVQTSTGVMLFDYIGIGSPIKAEILIRWSPYLMMSKEQRLMIHACL